MDRKKKKKRNSKGINNNSKAINTNDVDSCINTSKQVTTCEVTDINNDFYETVVFEHNFQKEIMTDALQTVRDFILQRERILVGGMAIDFALRTIDKKLYPDNKFPDYDFISPIFHIDAYQLGEKIAEKYQGVSIIGAMHVSTMRVRLNFQETADITYVPENIIANIPTLKYNGFNIVHPHYQMIDQHRALSLPYESPPKETILNRWKKDIQRYDLLNSNFPLDSKPEPEYQVSEYELTYDMLDGECVSGYASLLYWIDQAKKDSDKGIAVLDTFGIPSIGLSTSLGLDTPPHWLNSWVETTKGIKLELPNIVYFSIHTDNFEELFKRFPGEKKYHNSLLDKIQRKILIRGETGSYEILDNRGDLRSAYKPFQSKRIWISNLQEVMCYLLTLGIFYKSPLAINTYLTTQKILFWACENYTKTKDEKYLKYLPTSEVYGQYNVGESNQISKENFDVMFERTKRTIFTPKNAYPEKGEKINTSLLNYDPTTSSIYQIDGNETQPFTMREFK